MPNEKALTLLGFASKAKKLSYGMDGTVYALSHGKSELAVVASDISPKSRKEVKFNCEKYGVKFVLSDATIEELSHAVGKKAGILSVNDNGFAESVCGIYEGGNANND